MRFGYEELKEYIKEDFDEFYSDWHFTKSQVVPAILNEYEHGKEYCKTEECVIYIAIALNFIKGNISLEELLGTFNLLFSDENLYKYRNEISNEFALMENDINFIKKHLDINAK